MTGQIRVKVSSRSSTSWTSVDNSTAVDNSTTSGINRNSSYNAEAPELSVFNSNYMLPGRSQTAITLHKSELPFSMEIFLLLHGALSKMETVQKG